MKTHLLDVRDDAQCARAYDVLVASKGLGRPWHRPPSLEESVLQWRHVDKAEPLEMWAVEDAGEVLGVASLWLPQEDNTSLAWFDVNVHPEVRRRGAGSALMQRAVERSTEERRTTLVTDTMVPVHQSEDHPHRRFLERHGFTLSNTEIIRHLPLPVPDDLLSQLAEEARPRYEGTYRLETHVNGVPQQQLPSLTTVMNQLAVDAPTGDLEFEEESLDPARYAEYLELERQQKRTRLTTVAIHEPTGDVVGYTDLILPAGAPTVVWQDGTLVHRDHRGHRLGMAVKIENLRRLQSQHPGRERVVTGNDDTNSWMVDINERLGFEVVELCPAYQRKLG
jgi:GNAT superfamily N-acetyltransferase